MCKLEQWEYRMQYIKCTLLKFSHLLKLFFEFPSISSKKWSFSRWFPYDKGHKGNPFPSCHHSLLGCSEPWIRCCLIIIILVSPIPHGFISTLVLPSEFHMFYINIQLLLQTAKIVYTRNLVIRRSFQIWRSSCQKKGGKSKNRKKKLKESKTK